MVERLFFALWPPAPVREALAQTRDGLPDRPARASATADLHLTLVFVGPVDPHLFSCVAAAGDDVVLAPFDIELRQLCHWPHNRMWVAEPAGASSALLNLVSQLQQNLLGCGFEPEKRPYRPHVTLARKAAPISPLPLQLSWRVEDFVLAASRRSQASAYQVLRRWTLRE